MRSHFVGIPALQQSTTAPEAAVVIDVLRAFTAAAWAFARGAERIVLTDSTPEALALKAANPGWLAVKDGAPTEGFDTVNSPAMIRELDLTGRTLVQRTTFGTVGAQAAREAGLLLCASFVVAGATARLLSERGPAEVTYVVTGDEGRAEEDRACAEYLTQLTAGGPADPAEHLRRAAASQHAAHLAEGVRKGYPGIHPEDVSLCLTPDTFDFAMLATVEPDGLTLRALPC
ncbi:2-phosphosulfolactate phosphatase [Kitasatospora sp. MMS16-BH015]|uniref:2-phosphosulfolactate phosphatase n=1 Tax=Kitasatospora sp. MMS16-BH015 TaxID=2018025 RepID=UPI000CA245D5|nr:2-phosphosulfolactate phosphatase [Kitasatospora sp. MMS16-BH015]AUG76988.1 2-phosphosulfolactate phosphatase [Kitasatospora sp. MMS16-BH015]